MAIRTAEQPTATSMVTPTSRRVTSSAWRLPIPIPVVTSRAWFGSTANRWTVGPERPRSLPARRSVASDDVDERPMSADGDEPIHVGSFAAWLDQMSAALRGDADADVPCGSCTACCTSSQFVPIGPDEVDALAHIPADLLFPVP